MAGPTIITSALKATLNNLSTEKAGQGNNNKGSNQSANAYKGAQSASSDNFTKDTFDVQLNPESIKAKIKDLDERLSKIGGNLRILEKAETSIRGVEKELRQADRVVGDSIRTVARSAAEGSAPEASLVSQAREEFNQSLDNIDKLVSEQDSQAVNLLRGDVLETRFTGISNAVLQTQGSDFSVAGLGIDRESLDFSAIKDLASLSDILRSSLEGARGLATAIETDAREIETKQDFAFGTIQSLQAGLESLDNIGQTEEGANLYAQRANEAFSEDNDGIAADAQEELLKYF